MTEPPVERRFPVGIAQARRGDFVTEWQAEGIQSQQPGMHMVIEPVRVADYRVLGSVFLNQCRSHHCETMCDYPEVDQDFVSILESNNAGILELNRHISHGISDGFNLLDALSGVIHVMSQLLETVPAASLANSRALIQLGDKPHQCTQLMEDLQAASRETSQAVNELRVHGQYLTNLRSRASYLTYKSQFLREIKENHKALTQDILEAVNSCASQKQLQDTIGDHLVSPPLYQSVNLQ